MVMNMISQGQVAANQRKLFGGFVVAVAVAVTAIALAWGAFAGLSTPNSVAPSRSTIQVLQEPGLLDQRAGERGGPVVIPSAGSTILTDGMVEHRRGELAPNGESVQKTGTIEFNGFGNTIYDLATPSPDQDIVKHPRSERGPRR
jgi:hypothetical protein